MQNTDWGVQIGCLTRSINWGGSCSGGTSAKQPTAENAPTVAPVDVGHLTEQHGDRGRAWVHGRHAGRPKPLEQDRGGLQGEQAMEISKMLEI